MNPGQVHSTQGELGQAHPPQCEPRPKFIPLSVNPGQVYSSQCVPRPSTPPSVWTQAKHTRFSVDPGQAHSSQRGPKLSALPSVQRVGKWFSYSPSAQGHPHLLAPAGVCPESLAQCFTKLSLRAQEPITDVERLVRGRGGVLGGSGA